MTQEEFEKVSKRKFRTDDGHLILMTPEEKDLFILDLTARLKYGVICLINRVDDFGEPWRNEKLTGFYYTSDWSPVFDFDGLDVNFAEKVKPYLRPMSSMTAEEIEEMYDVFERNPIAEGSSLITDLLNKWHLDHHNLIEKGLALKAPSDMYNIKQ